MVGGLTELIYYVVAVGLIGWPAWRAAPYGSAGSADTDETPSPSSAEERPSEAVQPQATGERHDRDGHDESALRCLSVCVRTSTTGANAAVVALM